MKSKLRTWAKRLGMGVLGVVVLVALLVAFLHTSAGGEVLRARVETRLGTRVNTTATLGKLSFSLFSGITLEELAILDRDGKKGITVRKIFVKPSFGEIIGGTVALDAVSIEGVNVDMRGREDGTTSLTGVIKPFEKNPKLHIIARSLTVSDVGVHSTKPDGLDVVVEKLGVTGNLDVWPQGGTTHGALTLSVASVGVVRPDLTLKLAEVGTKVDVSIDGPAVGREDSRGTVKLGPTNARARLERKDHPPIDRPLSLGLVTLDTTPERLGIALDALGAAVATIATAKVEARRKVDGSVDHVASAVVTTLLVRANEVEAFAGKRILASDLTIEAKAIGTADALTPDVTIKTAGGDVSLVVALDLRNPQITTFDAKLSSKGLDVPKIYVSDKVPPITLGDLAVTAKGTRHKETAATNVEGSLHVQNVHVRDLVVDSLDARARFADGIVTIDSLDLVALGQKANAKGRYVLANKDVDADLVLDARVGELVRKLENAKLLTTPPSPLVRAIALGKPAHVHVAGHLDGELTVRITELDARAAGGAVRGDVTATVVRGDTSKGEKAVTVRDVKADLDIRGLSLGEIGKLRGKTLPIAGRADGRVHLTGDPRAPNADVDLTVNLEEPADRSKQAGVLRVKAQGKGGRIEGHATLTSAGGEVLAKIDGKGGTAGGPIDASIDIPERRLGDFGPFLSAEAAAKLPPDARVSLRAHVKGDGRTPPRWTADLAAPDVDLATLPLSPERRGTVHGHARLNAHLEGTPEDVAGTIDIEAHDAVVGSSPTLDAHVKIAIADSATDVTVDASVEKTPVITGKITAGLGGRGLIKTATKGGLRDANPSLAGKLEIPDRSMAEWAKLVPSARDVPGHFGGTLGVSGAARDPALALDATYAGYPTLAGKEGFVRLSLAGKREAGKLTVNASDAVTLVADVSPQEIITARMVGNGEAHVKLAITSNKAPLAAIVPATERTKSLGVRGVIESDLTANATIAFHDGDRGLGALDVRGTFAVREASLDIPTTRRHVTDVSLVLTGDGEAISIAQLSAKESDRAEPSRTLGAHGRFGIRDRDLALHLDAHRVLVSGGNFGELDAPKAALSANIDVKAALGGKVRTVVVDVNALELDSPDRQPRAVQQEVLSLGDVLELSSGIEIGKLPSLPSEPKATEPVRPEDKNLDITVRIAKTAHVKQRPLDLYVVGEVHIEKYGDQRVLSGALDAVDGSLLVGGREHRVSKGSVKMTTEGPFLDLHFRRKPHPAALRDMTTEGDTAVYAHMVGVFGRQKISFSGKADGLFEGLAFENLGRVRVLSTPDAPLTQTAQLPQTPQIRQTAFMSANLPHLAVLDRANTYADPNVSRSAYGRFENLEAERYSKDGTRRLRTTVRPRVIGQSDSEVEGSLLFTNTPRVVSGVGVVGGTRVGGGPVIFWEWSSAD